jgi:UDP-glucosyltransferase BX8/BX9
MAAPAPSTTGAPLGRRRHVLLFPLPFQSHINPMFRLAGLLHARGFAVTVFHTGFNAPDPAQHPAYRLVPVPVGVSGSNPVPDDIAEAVSRIVAFADACGAALRERLTAVLQEYSSKDDDVACLIADAHLLPVVRVTNQLGLPALALRTGSAASYTSLAAYPMLCEKATSLYKDVVRDFLPGSPFLKASTLVIMHTLGAFFLDRQLCRSRTD